MPRAGRAPDLLVNRMSPSADRRGHGHGILATLQYLEMAEAAGITVINGAKAYGFEISKVRQMALLADLGLPFPKTRVINHASEALAATDAVALAGRHQAERRRQRRRRAAPRQRR